MNFYKTQILKKEILAKDTIGIYLQKPEDFKFIPGQYIYLGLERYDLPDYERFRELSIGSSPNEDFLLVGYRAGQSIFKRDLDKLETGSEMLLEGPFGRFILDPDPDITNVLIAGGIGVIPFRSMIRDAKPDQKIYLFCSNHDLSEAPFYDELEGLTEENANFAFIPTLTSKNIDSSWQGERGYITWDLLSSYVKDTRNVVYYICGFPDMVYDLRLMLNQEGVNSARIITESFTGY